MSTPPQRLVGKLEQQRLLPIIRTASADESVRLASALLESQAEILEVTLTTPDVLMALREIKRRARGDVMVGVGTVVNPREAEEAILAGADFIVSPGLSADVLMWAADSGVAALPGVLTPSEVMQARDLGAAAVKLFPAATGGPAYLSALRAPLPDIAYVPTGGITVGDASMYLEAGAIAVGIGSTLFGGASEGLSGEELVRRARTALASMKTSMRPETKDDCDC